MQIVQSALLQNIQDYCKNLEKEFSLISFERRRLLHRLSEYITYKLLHQETPRIIVICTHNSRRSHLGQIWLSVGANYYNLPIIETYSGGTEATAFNERAVAALQKIGFQITSTTQHSPTNPIYKVNWLKEAVPYAAFSKKYDNVPNPTTAFAAVMVCTSADEGCPFVAGADFRQAIPYEDPKAFDNTPLEAEKYLERCRQIGREFLFVMSQVRI